MGWIGGVDMGTGRGWVCGVCWGGAAVVGATGGGGTAAMGAGAGPPAWPTFDFRRLRTFSGRGWLRANSL